MDSAVILYSFAQSFPIFLTFVEFLREFLSTQNWGTLLTRQKLRYFSGIEYKGGGKHLLAGAGGGNNSSTRDTGQLRRGDERRRDAVRSKSSRVSFLPEN